MMPAMTRKNGSNHLELARHESVWGTVLPLQPTPIQRILLVTDGTVTEILEAYAGESMRLIKLTEETVSLEARIDPLEMEAGEPALWRCILLQGSVSHVNFLYAESFIALDRLSPEMRKGLLLSRQPIGYLLQEQRLETFREIVSCGRERAGSHGMHFGISPEAGLISRTYRVIADRQPIMLITEKFPETEFPLGG